MPSSASAKRPVVYLPIGQSAVAVCASICLSSFNATNALIGQPAEFSSVAVCHTVLQGRISRATTFHLMAVSPAATAADSNAANWVDGLGEVLGMAILDCGDEVAGFGPLVVSTTAQCRGVGRELTRRCIEHAKERGVLSVRLVQIVANIAAFTLYHSLGFRAREYMVAVKGLVPAAQHQQLCSELAAEGVSIRAMEREDVATCNQLHIATTSFSRLPGITYSFTSQPSQTRQSGDKPPVGEPTVGCYVAVAASGAIVGYCTGWTKNSHYIGTSDNVVALLYSTLSQHLQAAAAEGEAEPSVIEVITQRNGELLEKLIAVGCRAERQTCLMSIGEYVPPHRYVYCPSILW